MYYDNARRQWAVDVGNGLNSPTRPTGPVGGPTTNEPPASQPQTGSNIFYYDYKSNAEGKLKAEKDRGKRAGMFLRRRAP